MATIYHLADRDCWIQQAEKGVYQGRAEDLTDGFLHFSDAAQIVTSAALHQAGNPDLVLLAVDAELLGAELKWEESRGEKSSRGGALFTHLYGELQITAVLWVRPLPLDQDGLHIFPALDDGNFPKKTG